MPRRRASIAASISAVAAGGGVAVPGQQLRRPGQELDHLPVRRRTGRQRHPHICRLGELAHLRRGERGGHDDVVPGQQLPRLSVRSSPSGGLSGRAVRASQNWGHTVASTSTGARAGVAQQLPQPGGNPFTQPGVGWGEVELGLVQPDHGPRPDARQLGQRRVRGGRVDRMP